MCPNESDVLCRLDIKICGIIWTCSEMKIFLYNFLQAPDKFVAAAARNPVCNIASMVGITDIPDWCYVEGYGIEGKGKFTEAPSVEDLTLFHSVSPISFISKVLKSSFPL